MPDVEGSARQRVEKILFDPAQVAQVPKETLAEIVGLSFADMSGSTLERVLGILDRDLEQGPGTASKRGAAPAQADAPDGGVVTRDTAIRSLITQAGGVFIGKEELVELGQLSADAKIPAIPEKYSAEFLQALHPLRDGTVSSYVILAFDPKSNQWLCIDRGNGGTSDIVPGSLGKDGMGLPGAEQDKIIEKMELNGIKLRSPKDSSPVERVLNNAIAMHLSAGKGLESLPFGGIWGRTADTERAAAGCRVLLGYSFQRGTCVRDNYRGAFALNDGGLLACWN